MIIFVLLVPLFPAVLMADYTSDLQAANTAYRAKQWDKAALYYRKAYAANPGPILKKFMNASASAAYKDDVTMANAAYKSGDKESALKHYKAAYSLFQVKQLQGFINKLQGTPLDDPVAIDKPGESNQTFKWVLIGTNSALAIGTIAAVIAMNSGVAEYNTLYDSINNTDLPSYNKLVQKKTSVEGTQTLFGALAVITGLAVTYTLLDAFMLHQAFPADVALNMENKGGQMALVAGVKF